MFGRDILNHAWTYLTDPLMHKQFNYSAVEDRENLSEEDKQWIIQNGLNNTINQIKSANLKPTFKCLFMVISFSVVIQYDGQ